MKIGGTPLRAHVHDVVAHAAHVPAIAADPRSAARYGADILLAKAMRVGLEAGPADRVGLAVRDRRRRIALCGGVELTYRLNRGDLQSIREIFAEMHYPVPAGLRRVDAYVDLGANIGAATLYMVRRLRPAHVVCVEPAPANARLVEENLRRNGVHATVIEAAVGSRDGIASFSITASSNLCRLSDSGGTPVRMVSVQSVLACIPSGVRIGLMKLDVEGAEEEILRGNIDWLDRVDNLVMEIHDDRVDQEFCVRTLLAAGFRRLGPERYEVHAFGRH